MIMTGKFSRWLWALMLVAAAGAQARDGVEVGNESAFAKLVPAAQVEQSALQQYAQLKSQASAQRALAPDSHPQVIRLRHIASKLIPLALPWNPRAKDWKWEINLIGSQQINAFCMPGGKIAFYTGILDKLKLTDDEVALVMGHEISHALREHARARMGKSAATNIGANVLGQLLGAGAVGPDQMQTMMQSPMAQVRGDGVRGIGVTAGSSQKTSVVMPGSTAPRTSGYTPWWPWNTRPRSRILSRTGGPSTSLLLLLLKCCRHAGDGGGGQAARVLQCCRAEQLHCAVVAA